MNIYYGCQYYCRQNFLSKNFVVKKLLSSKFSAQCKHLIFTKDKTKMAGKKRRLRRIKRQTRQKDGLLNRYDFAYAGRDVVNQAFKKLDQTAPGLLKDLPNELNKITE